MKYHRLRAEADENSSVLDLAAGGGAPGNRPSSAIYLPDTERTMAIIFAGSDAEDDTFSWTLYAWRDENAPAEFVANGTGIIGTQDVDTFPDGTAESADRWWADTLAITNDVFVRPLDAVDSGNNRVAKLRVKTAGYRYWYIEITNADGATGIEAGDISVWYSVFKDA